ncbi:hypothetical protein [uncultured Photobacterium sp.]|uniref:hypothetical protein n=1 Tax=uncultured Photobacterium sp. TaxID=173973 RepID=UPI002624C365|nr:hypothetical protein [uncultured Photobacterium sp.]
MAKEISLKTLLSNAKFHADRERLANKHRISNDILHHFLTLRPNEWRMVEFITRKLDPYPNELLNDSFIEAFARGEKAIPIKYLTVTVNAAEYIKSHNLHKHRGYQIFTQDAKALYEAEIEQAVSFCNYLNSLTLTRIVESATFYSYDRKNGVQRPITSKKRIKSKGQKHLEEGQIYSANQITFQLTQGVAVYMFFLREFFTTYSADILNTLSTIAARLYLMLRMHAEANGKEKGWHLQLDLNMCNTLSGTNYKTLSQFVNNFKAPEEINRLTEYELQITKDEQSKNGRSYTKVNLFFGKKSDWQQIEQGIKKSGRPRLPPRPRVKAGSAAEGDWARKSAKILLDYQAQRQCEGKELPKADRERLAKYEAILGTLEGIAVSGKQSCQHYDHLNAG